MIVSDLEAKGPPLPAGYTWSGLLSSAGFFVWILLLLYLPLSAYYIISFFVDGIWSAGMNITGAISMAGLTAFNVFMFWEELWVLIVGGSAAVAAI